MQSFLEKTVQILCKKYGDDISELCVVLPNRRSGLFLKTHFAKALNKTFWTPEIYATEDFVALLANLEIADPTTLLFELYETIKNTGNKDPESFEEFSKWGQILLSDFNEIDSYLVNASQLFGNLKNMKELETWSLNNEEQLTDFQKQYLNFWKLLGKYYTDFASRLIQKKQVYQGMAFRMVAENVEVRVKEHHWKKIIFAGFNALNKAEETIIEKLLTSGKAEIIWDTDSYYINDPNQEAGRFLRRHMASGKFNKMKLPSSASGEIKDQSIIIEEQLLSTGKKSISIIGAAKNIAQAKVAGNLVDEIKKTDPSLQNTAVVLADENLLFPVLHSLPTDLKEVNVTMGYPLKNTPVAGYFDLVFNLHENALKLSKEKVPYSYYHSDIIKLLDHPYTTLLLTGTGKENRIKSVVQSIQQRNIVFASVSTLEKLALEKNSADEFKKISFIFNHWQNAADALSCITELIEILKNAIIFQNKSADRTNLELEYLFAFTKIMKRIQVLMRDYSSSITHLRTLRGIINQIIRNTALPFYGEPLMGLQIMGMLETRTLDFENIILLSCNEDILPSGKSVNSFIPFELKRAFGLPTYSDKDAIFAYHFYRLLQRSSNCYLLYNTESDALGSGEKSRFLTQLIYEIPKKNPNVTIREKLVNIPAIAEKRNSIVIEKSSGILEKLREKNFSPSLLNTYRNCSLQFYLQAIAGLEEAEEVEETIGADKLGNFIHEVLEKLFQPFIGKVITGADVKGLKKTAETTTIEAFEKEYSKSEINYGKNLLTLKVALKFIHTFLDAESETIDQFQKNGQPLIIKALEQKLETTISIGSETIKLKGKADRIDSIGKTIRIIDYKTGIVQNKELKLDNWDAICSDSALAKSFQLLMYALIFHKMNPNTTDHIISGIITFRELSAGLKTVKINNNEALNAAILKEFEDQLKNILREIFDPAIPFTQTSSLTNCEYCSFKGICNRL